MTHSWMYSDIRVSELCPSSLNLDSETHADYKMEAHDCYLSCLRAAAVCKNNCKSLCSLGWQQPGSPCTKTGHSISIPKSHARHGHLPKTAFWRTCADSGAAEQSGDLADDSLWLLRLHILCQSLRHVLVCLPSFQRQRMLHHPLQQACHFLTFSAFSNLPLNMHSVSDTSLYVFFAFSASACCTILCSATDSGHQHKSD